MQEETDLDEPEVKLNLELTLPGGVTLSINKTDNGASISQKLQDAIEVLKQFTKPKSDKRY
jgi:hypothetical protein